MPRRLCSPRVLAQAAALLALASGPLAGPIALAQPKPTASAQPKPAASTQPKPAPYTQPKPAGSAQPKPAGTASAGPIDKEDLYSGEDERIALEQYKKGAELANKKKWSEAYPLFRDAWLHLRHWQIALGLGGVELELGKFKAAADHFTFVGNAADIQEPYRSEAAKRLAQALEQLGTVHVVATAPGAAEVWVDDEMVGPAPFSGSTPVEPGEHRIEVRSAGRREGRSVTVTKGSTAEVQIDMRPPAPEAAPEPTAPRPRAGAAFPKVPVMGGLLGLSAGAIALGIGLFVASDGPGKDASQKLAALPALQPRKCSTASCQAVHSALVAQANLEAGAVVAFTVAGLSALGALSIVFLPSLLQPKKAAVIVPMLGPSGAGLAAQGSF